MARMFRLFTILAIVGLVAGCSNPAANVPEATVKPVKSESPTEIPLEPMKVDANAKAAAGEVVAFDGENSKIEFVGSKVVGGSHDGGFKQFEGQFTLSPNGDEVRAVSTEIDMNSIWADNDKLTDHLKNADFFEVETYPTASFTSTSIDPASEGQEDVTHKITGDLTMHGQTNTIIVPATIAVTDDAVTLDSEFSINRTDWGIVYGVGIGDRAIREEVVIRLDLNAPRGSATAE